PIQNLRTAIKKIARSQAPVFVTGESGTGKEVVANLIHRLSNRSEGPFIAINCGAIPTELMESELFGHKKGSFTGATQDKQGLILSAHGGSLFLDEIAELPLSMQVKLLRAVQEKKIRPVGSDQEIDVDFRVISASHQDLDLLVQQGKFRQDLFFRIHVMDIMLPPL
ncbi:sigma 54-interacting transcriptional regulator, partial [Acinetobacter sp. TUM15064]